MIPKVEFRYSMVYDRIWMKGEPKSREFMLKYINDVAKLWRKKENKILYEMQKITGLKWKEKRIICYVNSRGRSFSEPLTVIYNKDKNDFVDTLTHEMIHQIQIQGAKNFPEWVGYLKRKYPNGNPIFLRHILLHAVHKRLFLELFDKKRLNREIKSHQPYPDYKRAWDVVEEEGYENIIKDFKRVMKL